jgi:hypothetical protein
MPEDMDRWRVLVKALMKLRFPLNAGIFLTGGKPVSFTRLTMLLGVSKNVSQPSDIISSVNNPLEINGYLINRYTSKKRKSDIGII